MSKITLVANALLPSFVFIMLVYASCAQIVSCFHRDTVRGGGAMGAGPRGCGDHTAALHWCRPVVCLVTPGSFADLSSS